MEAIHYVRLQRPFNPSSDQLGGCTAEADSAAFREVLHLLQNVVVDRKRGSHESIVIKYDICCQLSY
jgi:hypothetical protein